MKHAERRCKRLDYRHILCVLITLGFVACSAFVFPTAFGRLIEGFRDFGVSVGVYFTRIIGMPNAVTPTVTELPKIPLFGLTDSTLPSIFLPETWEGFKADFVAFWNSSSVCFVKRMRRHALTTVRPAFARNSTKVAAVTR